MQSESPHKREGRCEDASNVRDKMADSKVGEGRGTGSMQAGKGKGVHCGLRKEAILLTPDVARETHFRLLISRTVR